MHRFNSFTATIRRLGCPRRALLISLTVLPWLGNPAFAGRPLHTDDAGMIERGACQLELWRNWTRAEQRWTVSPGCTPFGQTELSLLYAHVDADDERGLAVHGGQLKQVLSTGAGMRPALAVALAAERDRRLHRSGVLHGNWLLNALATWTNDAATRALHLNLGALQSRDDTSATPIRDWQGTWALAFESEARSGLWLAGEPFGQSGARTSWQLSLRRALHTTLQLDAGFGAEVGRWPTTRQFNVGVVWLSPVWF